MKLFIPLRHGQTPRRVHRIRRGRFARLLHRLRGRRVLPAYDSREACAQAHPGSVPYPVELPL